MHVSKNRCYLASEIPGGYPDATGPGVTGLPTNYDYDLSPRAPRPPEGAIQCGR